LKVRRSRFYILNKYGVFAWLRTRRPFYLSMKSPYKKPCGYFVKTPSKNAEFPLKPPFFPAKPTIQQSPLQESLTALFSSDLKNSAPHRRVQNF
jgi:hypothetical protein